MEHDSDDVNEVGICDTLSRHREAICDRKM